MGSIRVVLNSTNTVISAQDYDAWGYVLENRTYNSAAMKYDFTGKERDNETNYDYFGARYYDSRIGRWGGVDPQQSKLPGWTPYRAFLDNPINIIDPDGRIEIPEKYRQDYPKLVNYLEKNLVKIGTEKESIAAFQTISDLTYDQIKDGLEINSGKGPVLNITELGYNTSNQKILGKYDNKNKILYVDIGYVKILENSSGDELEVMQFLVAAIVLHESAHAAFDNSSKSFRQNYVTPKGLSDHVATVYEQLFFGGSVTTYNAAVTTMNNRNFMAGKAKRYQKKEEEGK